MSELSSSALKSAVQYNRSRPYSRADWRRIQKLVGCATDGIPGANTARKVALYQGQHKLTVDGKVGKGTLAAMSITIGSVHDICLVEPAPTFFFSGGMSIDADGAPNAYNEEDTGIDYLANAGRPGNWYGIAVDDGGVPYKQKDGPFAGYYISTTAMVDGRYPRTDPRRYIDSTRVPYFVLPRNFASLVGGGDSMKKGDLAAVLPESDLADADGSELVFAIYADVGPTHSAEKPHLGEGSVALAQAMGHDPYVMRKGVRRALRSITSELVYILFPGSGTGKPLGADEIDARGRAAFDQRGGKALLATIRKMRGMA